MKSSRADGAGTSRADGAGSRRASLASSPSASSATSKPAPVTTRRALIAELLKADEPDPAPAPVAHDDGSPGEDQARFTLEGLLAFKRSADLLVKGKSQDKVHNTGSHSIVRNWLVSYSLLAKKSI